MDARAGLYLIEGNHDLIENGDEFERRVKQSGIPFFLEESAVVTFRGAPVATTRASLDKNLRTEG